MKTCKRSSHFYSSVSFNSTSVGINWRYQVNNIVFMRTRNVEEKNSAIQWTLGSMIILEGARQGRRPSGVMMSTSFKREGSSEGSKR